MPPTSVLVLNCGSSSVKFAVIDPATGARLVHGLGERLGSPEAVLHLHRGEDRRKSHATPGGTHRDVVAQVLEIVQGPGGVDIAGVGHRVVHGGARFTASVRIDDDVLDGIRAVCDLAPLHVPANLAGIEAVTRALPDLPQIAVFDTAFHATMPPRAYRYAVPQAWYDEHAVRRYGFHGTSHRYVAERAAVLLGRPPRSLRLVTAHLGNGCSATAVRDGVSVDTTMGLTPLEGLVMGTRSGDVDPGLLGYVGDRLGLGLAEVLDALNTRSGLLGLSGTASDLRSVSEAARPGNGSAGSEAARLALEVFCYRLAKHVAALVVPLERLDVLVFTGGIGENSAEVRSRVLGSLAFLGLEEDTAANAVHGRDTDGRVSQEGAVLSLVVPTDEELVIARDTAELVRPRSTT